MNRFLVYNSTWPLSLFKRKKVLSISDTTKVSKAQQKAVHKYVKNNYDRIELTVSKGHKAEIKAHADAHKESVNGFINRAIDETMERDNQ